MLQKKIKINQARNVNSVNVDFLDSIELKTNQRQIEEYEVTSTLLISELAEQERQESLNFRIYGKINYLSVLNNLISNYTKVEDLFNKYSKTGNSLKTFTNSFDVYLLIPTNENIDLGSNKYNTKYKVVSKIIDIDITKSGFGRNIFNEQEYLYTVSNDLNIDGLVDSFGKPLTRAYLYFNFKSFSNGDGISGYVSKKIFDSSSTETSATYTSHDYNVYEYNDIIDGDLVEYIPNNFLESTINEMEYLVHQPLESSFVIFKYRPFHEIKLREFSTIDEIQNINSPDIVERPIPNYAVDLGNGNFLWRDFLDFGFIEPLTTIGVNFPFVNNTHYVFSNIVLSLVPNLDDSNTATIFNEINFGNGILNRNVPITQIDSNDLNSKC